MTIQFYSTSQDDRTVNKTLNAIGDKITGKLLTANKVLNPAIAFNKNIPIDANYAYISYFDRYYFIRDISQDSSGIITVQFYVDVLMSYKEEILNSIGKVTSGNSYNPYATNAIPIDTRGYIKAVNFDNPFSETKNNILITVRG